MSNGRPPSLGPEMVENPWHVHGRPQYGPNYFNVSDLDLVLQDGRLRVFEQMRGCYLYVIDDEAVAQRGAVSQRIIHEVLNSSNVKHEAECNEG